MLNLVWVPFVAFVGIAIPDKVLTIPILAAFVVSVAAFRLRSTGCGWRSRAARCSARCSPRWRVQWTVARAVGIGLIKDRLPFVRTAKGGTAAAPADFPAFWEAVLGGLLRGQRHLPARHQLGAGARDQSVRPGAGGAVAAVPGLGRTCRSSAPGSTTLRSGAGWRPGSGPADAPTGHGAGPGRGRQAGRAGAVTTTPSHPFQLVGRRAAIAAFEPTTR